MNDDGWVDFMNRFGRKGNEGGLYVRIDAKHINLPKALYEDLGKPKQIYYRYSRTPLAIAIVPINKPVDIPTDSIKVYKVWQQGISAVALWRYLGITIKQPQRLPVRLENGQLVIEIEGIQ